MKIRLDDSGRVDHIERIENDESHQLIEEFMLLANEAVAAKPIEVGRPTIHRVHEAPEERCLAEYREGPAHRVPCGNLARRPEVQKLLRHLGSLELGPALKIGFLKSLMRARYAVESLGHYGLAKKHYTHFTSPIRRYSDLVVHRSLFERVPAKSGDMRDIAGTPLHHGTELCGRGTGQQGCEAVHTWRDQLAAHNPSATALW